MRLFKEKYTLVALCISVLLTITAPVAMAASGSGGEPGGGCPTENPDQRFSFVPSPYLGTLIVKLETDAEVKIFTDPQGVVQTGDSGCALNIDTAGEGFFWFAGVLSGDFQNVTAKNLQDTCVEIALLGPFLPPSCVEGAFFQIVAAHGLQFNEAGDQFTVDVVMMQVELK